MDVHWKLRVSAMFCRFSQNELFTAFVLLEVNHNSHSKSHKSNSHSSGSVLIGDYRLGSAHYFQRGDSYLSCIVKELGFMDLPIQPCFYQAKFQPGENFAPARIRPLNREAVSIGVKLSLGFSMRIGGRMLLSGNKNQASSRSTLYLCENI